SYGDWSSDVCSSDLCWTNWAMPAATEPQATAGGEHTSRLALRLSRAHFIPPARWSRSAGGHHLGDERDQLGIPGLPSWRIATTVRLLSGAPFLLKSVARRAATGAGCPV